MSSEMTSPLKLQHSTASGRGLTRICHLYAYVAEDKMQFVQHRTDLAQDINTLKTNSLMDTVSIALIRDKHYVQLRRVHVPNQGQFAPRNRGSISKMPCDIGS